MKRRGALLAAIAVALGFIATHDARAGATAPGVGAVILTPAQVGSGFTGTTIPGGRQVKGQVTLDLCGQDYASEAKRLQRLQTVYARKGGTVALSNEVVRYKPGGALQALAEVRRHVRTAPTSRSRARSEEVPRGTSRSRRSTIRNCSPARSP